MYLYLPIYWPTRFCVHSLNGLSAVPLQFMLRSWRQSVAAPKYTNSHAGASSHCIADRCVGCMAAPVIDSSWPATMRLITSRHRTRGGSWFSWLHSHANIWRAPCLCVTASVMVDLATQAAVPRMAVGRVRPSVRTRGVYIPSRHHTIVLQRNCQPLNVWTIQSHAGSGMHGQAIWHLHANCQLFATSPTACEHARHPTPHAGSDAAYFG